MDGTAGEGCDGEAAGEGPVAGEPEVFRRRARHCGSLYSAPGSFCDCMNWSIVLVVVCSIGGGSWGIFRCSSQEFWWFGWARKIIVFCRLIGFLWLGRVGGGRIRLSADLAHLCLFLAVIDTVLAASCRKAEIEN